MSATANIRVNAHTPSYRFIREIEIHGVTESLDEVQMIGDLIARLAERRDTILSDRENTTNAGTQQDTFNLARDLGWPKLSVPPVTVTIGPGYVAWQTTLDLLSQASREAVYTALCEEEQRRSDEAAHAAEEALDREPFYAVETPDPPGTAHAFGSRYAVDPPEQEHGTFVVEIH